MAVITPVSDLRNYNNVLEKVSVGSPVYLTVNGRGKYTIRDIAEDEDGDHEIRIDSDGAFLEWKCGKKKFTCIYYKEDDKDESN